MFNIHVIAEVERSDCLSELNADHFVQLQQSIKHRAPPLCNKKIISMRNPKEVPIMTNNEIDFNKALEPTPESIVALRDYLRGGAAQHNR